MAEVLSQSQIDALLNAARNGEMDLAAKAESSSEKKYRKYDFYSPRKFTKDRLKMLSGIFENYTRIINSRINGLLHTTCEIDVESVEEQRYYEFSNALLEGDVLSLAGVELEGQVSLFHYADAEHDGSPDGRRWRCGQPTSRRLQFHQFGAEAL